MKAAETIGPLFMTGMPGLTLDDSSRRLIAKYRLNNFIIFTRNVDTPSQLAELCTAIKDECTRQGTGKPLIAIDQEGGTVTRLPPPFTQFADARDLAEGNNPRQALSDYAQICADELRDIGINMNFAPVLDICPAGQGFFMERRSFGADPATTAELGRLIIEVMQDHGIAACGKHFPGLGAATLDPHELLPVVNRAGQLIIEEDIMPFAEAIAADVAAIMTSHTIYKGLDPDHPATMSRYILTDILRIKLGYDGLVVTDDLEMGAVEKNWPIEDAALNSFMAGADLLLICHEHDKVIRSIQHFSEAQKDNTITAESINKSLSRVEFIRNKFAA